MKKKFSHKKSYQWYCEFKFQKKNKQKMNRNLVTESISIYESKAYLMI